MKTRNGFVSNSSSSSFVIGYTTKFIDDFKKDIEAYPDNPFTCILQDVGECLDRNVDEKFTSLEDFLQSEYYEWNKDSKMVTTYIRLLKDGYKLAIGSISTESDYDLIDTYLCHKELKYKSENIYIETKGGY